MTRSCLKMAVLPLLFFAGSEEMPLVAQSPGPSLVTVDDHRLVLQRRNPDGTLAAAEPYVMHGIAWAPAGRDTEDTTLSRRQAFEDWYSTDIPAMAALGINTVRLYLDPGLGASGRAVLDKLYEHDIMAVLTVDEEERDLDRTRAVVEAYRDHPAVLMWLIGNEWNINLYLGNEDCAPVEQAARCTEEAAQLVRSLDQNHPVATSYGDIDIDDDGRRLADTARYVNEIAPSVDVWGLNVFRGADFGSLFDQWRTISRKPVFIAEFGTDALKMPEGLPDETLQAHWELCLWNDLLRELSGLHPKLPAIGGTPFEWNDEWWKVAPAGSHDEGGFVFPGSHPDDFANEEYFGIVDIDRQERRAAGFLARGYDPDYQNPVDGPLLGVASRGASAAQFSGQFGYARFYNCGRPFYNELGGGGGGRGFNAVILDPTTGDPLQPPTNFDTYITRSECAVNDPSAAMFDLIAYLAGAPSGSVILLAVADEAGLTQDNSCTPFSTSSCFSQGLAALEGLGSQKIRDYCFRDSWAMIGVKGEETAIAEGLASGEVVSLDAQLPDPGSFLLTVTKGGTGAGTVMSDAGGINCGPACANESAQIASGALASLAAVPEPDSWFSGWSGDSDCGDGVVWLGGDRACTATFEPGCAPTPVELRYHSVVDEEIYRACESILAANGFRVTATGRLSLQSGESVALGDGFVVEAGGKLGILIDPSLTEDP